MYQGQVLGVSTVGGGVAAIAVLPETGANPVFTYAAFAAIAIGTIALILQTAAAFYRYVSRSK